MASPKAKRAESMGVTRLMMYMGTYMATHPMAGKDTSMPPEISTTISHRAKHMVKMPARQMVMTVAGLKNAG